MNLSQTEQTLTLRPFKTTTELHTLQETVREVDIHMQFSIDLSPKPIFKPLQPFFPSEKSLLINLGQQNWFIQRLHYFMSVLEL